MSRHLSTTVSLATVAVIALACVTVGPVASPSGIGNESPSPSLPVATPTLPPTPTPTPTPTAAPTATPTPTTAAPTATPTTAPTPTPTEPPVTAQPTQSSSFLNFALDPNYGQLELDSGFVPDPTELAMTSGGSVNADYLEGCRGWATSAPDLSVRYTIVGSPSLLRFYFVGSGDTTLIINDPIGNWVCSDDSFSSYNPTVDLPTPVGGRYDIWVGSYVENTPISGTLFVTELESNHP